MACQWQTQICSNLCTQGIVTELSEHQSRSLTNKTQNNSVSSTELEDMHALKMIQQTKLEHTEQTLMGITNILESISKRFCNGIMGVPITVIDKLNPKQFDIIGCSSSWMIAGIEGSMPSTSFMELVNKGKVRTGGTPGKSKVCWVDNEGFANVGYHRIFIQKII